MKRWKQKKEETKAIMRQTPKSEHMVYFVDFKTRSLEEKVEVTSENLLSFNKPKTKRPRKKKPSETTKP
jgi:hypothetical protein